MKAQPKKLVNSGKVGQVLLKQGKTTAGTSSMQKLDKKSVGSAMGILGKHYK
jgi:hypothetical protein